MGNTHPRLKQLFVKILDQQNISAILDNIGMDGEEMKITRSKATILYCINTHDINVPLSMYTLVYSSVAHS